MLNRYFKIFLSIALLLVWPSAKAQQASDSLLNILNTAISYPLPDSTLARMTYQVAEAYEKEGSYTEAIVFYGKAAIRFEKNNNYKGHFNSIKRQGIMSWRTSQHELALKLYAQAQKLAEANHDSAGISSCLNNSAIIYWARSNHLKAIELFQQALEITRSTGQRNNEARTIGNIGMIYSQRKDFAKALEYYQQALTILEELQDQAGISIYLANVASVYSEYELYQKSLAYYERALEIQEELGDKKIIAICLKSMGTVYLDMDSLSKSESLLKQSLDLERESKNETGEPPILNSLARIAVKRGQYMAALRYARRSQEIASKHGLVSAQMNAYELLSEIYESTGNRSKSLSFFKQYTVLKDSLFNQEKNEQLSRVAAEFAFRKEELRQKSENEKEKLELKNQISINKVFRNVMLFAFLIGSGLIVSVAFAYKHKSRANKLLKEKNKKISGQNQKIIQQNEELNYTNMQLVEARMDMLEALENEREAYENLKQAEKQLIQAEKMASLGQLTAGISHEINNPLNYITGSTEILEINFKEIKGILSDYFHNFRKAHNEAEKDSLTQELEDKVTEIDLIADIEHIIPALREGSGRILNIVNSLKVFASDGKDVPTLGNIHTDIDATISLLGGKWKENIRFKTNYGTKIPQFYAYHSLLNQMLLYLLTNAVESINGEGEIRIETRMLPSSQENELEVIIQDTGCGIPQDIKNKIFDPFFSTKVIGKSAGLGLSQVYSIVEKHEGKVRFTSEEGIGTIFHITLPTDRFIED